jgi:Kef-type K+ transport system membrane component KefB
VAAASAPAGTVVVLQEYKAQGTLTSLLLAIVGLDDGLGVMIYAFAISVAKLFILHSSAVSFPELVRGPVVEIVGALVLGGCIGIVLAFAVRKARTTGEMLSMVLGGTLICAGMSNVFGVSLILSNLVVGAAVANVSPRSVRRAFGAVQNITAPIYILFFVLAGAHLQLRLLPSMGLVGLVYILSRSAGKAAGSWAGATISHMESKIRKYVGLGLLSQAGLAVGLALMVGRQLGDMGADGARLALLTINTVAATTIVFEIIGPIMIKIAITGAGEVGKMEGESASQEVSG